MILDLQTFLLRLFGPFEQKSKENGLKSTDMSQIDLKSGAISGFRPYA